MNSTWGMNALMVIVYAQMESSGISNETLRQRPTLLKTVSRLKSRTSDSEAELDLRSVVSNHW